MKVLILTGRFGMGHIKSACALKEVISKNAQVEVVDLVEFLFPRISGMIYKGFGIMVTKMSGMYNLLNKIAGKMGGVPLRKTAVSRIDNLLMEHDPDLVISNLPLCSQYFSSYKKMRECNIPLYTYVTDITFHNEWVAENTDLYFTGDVSTRDAIISAGVPAGNVRISGIPVSESFHSKEKSGERKKVLVMGGGLGLIPCNILSSLDSIEDADVVLIAGHNRKLYDEVKGKFTNIKVFGYTDNIPQLMADADLLISKPGGITMFEAIRSRTPLYIVKPELEQEIGNAGFIERTGIGKVVYSMDEFSKDKIMSLLDDEEEMRQMKENMKRVEESFEDFNPLVYFKGERLCRENVYI